MMVVMVRVMMMLVMVIMEVVVVMMVMVLMLIIMVMEMMTVMIVVMYMGMTKMMTTTAWSILAAITAEGPLCTDSTLNQLCHLIYLSSKPWDTAPKRTLTLQLKKLNIVGEGGGLQARSQVIPEPMPLATPFTACP